MTPIGRGPPLPRACERHCEPLPPSCCFWPRSGGRSAEESSPDQPKPAGAKACCAGRRSRVLDRPAPVQAGDNWRQASDSNVRARGNEARAPTWACRVRSPLSPLRGCGECRRDRRRRTSSAQAQASQSPYRPSCAAATARSRGNPPAAGPRRAACGRGSASCRGQVHAALASIGAATSMQGRPSGCGQLWSGTRAQRTSGRSDSQVTRPAVACSMFGQRSGGTRPFQPHTEGVLMPSMRATAAGPPRSVIGSAMWRSVRHTLLFPQGVPSVPSGRLA
jgi:hypothetical protein